MNKKITEKVKLNQQIAIIDDDIFFCHALKKSLNSAGLNNIDVYTDEYRFLTSLKTYGIIFIDHFLNKNIGMNILAQYNKLHQCEKIIYISGYPKNIIAYNDLKNISNSKFIFLTKSNISFGKIGELID